PNYRWQPDHPLAIKTGKHKGYVAYPKVDMNTEFVDALEAVRAYEANVGVMEITKNLGQQTLRILV
ncbi:MAG: flagellar basal body rod C-terminal domain-containing protein, partial [Planctomycetota bacterium]|nr:flagellar basal body rod C-terminal domain-containing protein [Planctomycetota bacterium]